ncbi:Protein unc-79 [Homalodisca vitripennis]|nr:Protein unc-79 [Homalodisca vitripennis]
MLDPEMSPLGFEVKKLFHFISVRFKQTTPKVMEQALNWLQVLTILDIVIHRHLLFTFFEDGINSMKEGDIKERDKEIPRKSCISPVIEDESGHTSGISDDEGQTSRKSKRQHSDGELKLSCCVLMLDISRHNVFILLVVSVDGEEVSRRHRGWQQTSARVQSRQCVFILLVVCVDGKAGSRATYRDTHSGAPGRLQTAEWMMQASVQLRQCVFILLVVFVDGKARSRATHRDRYSGGPGRLQAAAMDDAGIVTTDVMYVATDVCQVFVDGKARSRATHRDTHSGAPGRLQTAEWMMQASVQLRQCVFILLVVFVDGKARSRATHRDTHSGGPGRLQAAAMDDAGIVATDVMYVATDVCQGAVKTMEKQGVERHTGIHTVVAQDACRLLQWMMQALWLATDVCQGAVKTMEKQGVERHTGIHTVVAQDACRLLQWMMQASWLATHVCQGSAKTECVHCELTIVWHQLALELVLYIAQENPAHPPDPPLQEIPDEHKSPGEDKKAEPKPDVVINMPLLEIHTVGGVLVNMPHVITL